MTTQQGAVGPSVSDPADTPDPQAPAPLPHNERSLAPDLARGMMLLFIALANVVGYLHGRPLGPGSRPVDSTAVDRLADTLVSLFIDSRSYPMFAILVGYGTATMARRAAARGSTVRQTRRLLARRSRWLVVLGIVHSGLLFFGDILVVYGMVGLIAAHLVHRRTRTLVWWSAVSFVSMAVLLTISEAGDDATIDGNDTPNATADYFQAATERLVGHLSQSLLMSVLLFLVGLFAIGFALSRTGALDHPEQHRPALRCLALTGLAINLTLGLPHALTVGRYLHPDHTTGTVLFTLHEISGWFMGLTYICLFALLAARLRGPDGQHTRHRWSQNLATRISAVGERSLTCYLTQSIVLAPLLCAWGAGLGAHLSTTAAYALAAATWLLTFLLANALAAASRRGPFEVALRALTYRTYRAREPRPGNVPG